MKAWTILYNHPTYGECLERLVYGTKERAEEIAARCKAETGKEYWVADGEATARAFEG